MSFINLMFYMLMIDFILRMEFGCYVECDLGEMGFDLYGWDD